MQQPLKFTWPIFLMLTLTTMALAQQPFRLADREVKPLLERLEDRTDHFRDALSKGLKNPASITAAAKRVCRSMSKTCGFQPAG